MKPMLACNKSVIPDQVNLPALMSPKLDGIRCLIIDGKPCSRNLKPIPNRFINQELTKLSLPAVDGELMIVGDFNSVQSAVMSEDGKPDFTYMIFDSFINPKEPYATRFSNVVKMQLLSERVRYIGNRYVEKHAEIKEHFNSWIDAGFEGAIIRNPHAPYKFGRSTLREGYMLKMKKWFEDEAEIIGFEELLYNDNDPIIDKLGNQVRSDHQANKSKSGKLGSFVVKWKNVEFKVGTGLDDNQRIHYWKNKIDLLGSKITFKYQDTSKYGIPRFPVYKGFRRML